MFTRVLFLLLFFCGNAFAIDYQALNDELNQDPLGRGYASMTDQQASDDMNIVYRTCLVDAVGGSDICNNTDDAEYSALTQTDQARWNDLCGWFEVDVSSGIAKALEAEIFGPGTTTRSNLAALKNPPCSRAAELGFPPMTPGWVAHARSL